MLDGTDFDPTKIYVLFTYGGTLTNNGLDLGALPGTSPINISPAVDNSGIPNVVDQYTLLILPNANGIGGIVELAPVPEPSSFGSLTAVGLLARRRRRIA